MANCAARLRKTMKSTAKSSTAASPSVVVDRHFEAAAVLDMETARRHVEDALVVRRQHDRALGAHGEVLELIDHQPASDAVERRGRLVGDDEVWQPDHDAGDGDALLLAA